MTVPCSVDSLYALRYLILSVLLPKEPALGQANEEKGKTREAGRLLHLGAVRDGPVRKNDGMGVSEDDRKELKVDVADLFSTPNVQA